MASVVARRQVHNRQLLGGTVIGARGAMAPAPRSTSFDFVDGAANKLPAGVSYAARSGIVAYPRFRKVLRAAAANAAPVHERGLPLFPAMTNESANPRMAGSVAMTTPAFSSGVTVTSMETTLGSRVLKWTVPSHGRSVGDRWRANGAITAGGITAINADSSAAQPIAAAYTITSILDANSFETVDYRVSGSTNLISGSGTGAYAVPTGAKLPDGMEVSGAATRGWRIIQQSEGEFVTSPALGARRTLDIYGHDTGYLLVDTVAGVSQGDGVSISWPMYGEPKATDNMHFENLTLDYCFVECDGSGNPIGAEQIVNLDAQIGSSLYAVTRAKIVAAQAGCASVKIYLKASGTGSSDVRLRLYERMVAKAKYYPLTALPTTTGTSSIGASKLDPITLGHAVSSLAFELDIAEIVNTVDPILTCGGLQLQAVGASWPRDLCLTDGTNSVTLPGVLFSDFQTQGIGRVAMSWGGFGLRLAYSDIHTLSSASVGTFDASQIGSSWRIGENSDGSARSYLWAKFIEFSSQARTGAELASWAKVTRNVPWALPGVDYPIGHSGTLQAPPTSGSGNLNGLGGGTGVATATGSNITYTNATKRINISTTASDVVIENWDFRGWYVNWSSTVTNITFRNCRFDMQQTATFSPSLAAITFPATTTGVVLMEYCTFERGAIPNDMWGLHIQNRGGVLVVRCCEFLGTSADHWNGLGGLVEMCRFRPAALGLNRHADCGQLNAPSLGDLEFRECVIDMRDVWGSRADGNSADIRASNDVIRHLMACRRNVIIGTIQAINWSGRVPAVGATGPTCWMGTAAAAVEDNYFEMWTVNPITLPLGAALRFGGSGSITVSGTAAMLAKLGLEAGTFARPYVAGALYKWQGTGTTPTYTDALDAATLLGGASTTVYKSSSPMLNGDAITIDVGAGAQVISFVPSGAADNNHVNIDDPVSTLLAKLTAVLGVSVDLRPVPSTVTGNKTLFREQAIAAG